MSFIRVVLLHTCFEQVEHGMLFDEISLSN